MPSALRSPPSHHKVRRVSASPKSPLSETDICDQFITPVLLRAGWTIQHHIPREYTCALAAWWRGQAAHRDKAFILRADYVLFHKPNVPLAVVEAKDAKHAVGAGMAPLVRRSAPAPGRTRGSAGPSGRGADGFCG